MSILDASVVLKWFIPEKDYEKADLIRSQYLRGMESIIVPDLVFRGNKRERKQCVRVDNTINIPP